MSPGQRGSHAAILRGLLVLFVLCELASRAGVMPSLVRGGLAPLLELPFFAPSLLGAFAAQLVLRPRRDELAVTAGLAAVLALPIFAVASGRPWAVANTLCATLGLAALASLAISAARRPGDEREDAIAALRPALILPAFVSLAHPMVYLTAVLWPTTYDHRMYAADWALGGPLSFTIARLTDRVPLLGPLCLLVYVCLPLALALVHAARQKRGITSSDALVAFVAVTAIGYAGYNVVPVTGPAYVFAGAFPMSPLDPAALGDARAVALPMPRNCMPSLHSAWALLVWWNARPLAAAARAAATAFFAVTLLATVALGFHYVVDLVAAFPLTLAAQAWATRVTDERPRRMAMLAGLAMTVAWIAAVTWLDGFLLTPAPVLWVVAAAITGASCFLERRVYDARAEAPARVETTARIPDLPGRANTWTAAAAACAVFLLGCAGWLHLAILANTLAPVAGATASSRALSTIVVVAALSAGIAASVRLERGIGETSRVGALAAGVLVPWSWLALEAALAVRSSGGFFFVELLLAIPAAFATGVAAPALAPRANRPTPPAWLAAVLFGAAAGALLAGYAVLPSPRSNLLVIALYVAAAILAVAVAVRSQARPADAAPAMKARTLAATLVIGAVAGIVLGVEAHLVIAMLGDTIYARAQAAALVCGGLAAGAWAAPRLPLRATPVRCFLAMVAILVATAPLYELVPGYFASFRGYIERHEVMAEFSQHEFIRFCCAMLFVLPLAVVAGASMSPARRGSLSASGRIAAWIMAAACGAGLAAFLLLPTMGSRATLVASAVVAVLAAVPLARAIATEAAHSDDVAAVVLLGLALATATIDVRALASDSALTFRTSLASPVRSLEESVGAIATRHADGEIRINGLVRHANDGRVGEDGAARTSALLVGLGTGAAARDLAQAGFTKLVVAEPVSAIVRLVDAQPDALPAVAELRSTDARSMLRSESTRYDLILVDDPELSGPEAATKCTTEFYALAAARLAPGGTLRQHIALERLSPVALASVLASARRSFETVEVLASGNLATLRACAVECPRLSAAHGRTVVETAGVDALLESVAERIAVPVATLASSDDDLFLRYQTPVSFRAAPDVVPESRTLLESFARNDAAPGQAAP